MQIYKLCDRSGYIYNVGVYQGKQSMTCTDVTPTHGIVPELFREVEEVGTKIFMDNYFTSPKIFSDLHHSKINACGTVCHNRKEMPPNFSPENLQLKRGNTVFRVWGNLRAVCWKDK
jgi:hypothetical protein